MYSNKKTSNGAYVEDVIVPVLAIPKRKPSKFRFLGSGFYVDRNGHFITCRHVVENLLQNEWLCICQLPKQRELELAVIKKSNKYDLALCKSVPPVLPELWSFIKEPLIKIGYDVELYGYWHEPRGPNKLPFRQRYLKGHITGIPIDSEYSDSYELSFPVLYGMSGSPLLYLAPVEGESKEEPCIVGCAYGSRQAEIMKRSITIEKNGEKHVEERVSEIVQLGLAYKCDAIISIFQEANTGVDIHIWEEEDNP